MEDQKVRGSHLFLSAAAGFLFGGVTIWLFTEPEHLDLGLVFGVIGAFLAAIGATLHSRGL